MERNTHPVVLVPAVIGGLALVAVMGMFLMMSGMRMPGCWAAGLLGCWTTEIRGALPDHHAPGRGRGTEFASAALGRAASD